MEGNKFETVNTPKDFELSSAIESFKKDLEYIEREYGGKVKMFEDRFNLHEDLIKKLLSEKEKFLHIFKTENGSIYFVTQDGRTLRIKKTRYDYELYPLSDEIIFRDGRGNKLNEPVIGSSPFETFTSGEYQGDPRYHEGHDIVEIIK